MSSHCGSVIADGNAVCIPSGPGQASACGCSSEAKGNDTILFNNDQEKTNVEKNS